MLFHEPLFLFLFGPTVGLAYLLARRSHAARFAVLLAASVAFYLWAEPVFVPVVVLSAALDHALARRIARGGSQAARLTALGVAANLGLLVYYKYLGFIALNAGFSVAAIALPVGLSFIVFEKITYLVDVRRGVAAPADRLASYLLYVFFFPKLLAGPIIKFHDFAAQLRAVPEARAEDFWVGFERFAQGVATKVLLANTLGRGADMVFGAIDTAPAAPIGGAVAWWGVALFTGQILFDFSAYSDMAIGLARMLGFRLLENFDRPYVSASVTEFWRRWHISLTSWIREYLYVPLGGNRRGVARQYANLWVCFLASGLWHGAAWTFVAWGAWNGAFLVLDRLVLLRVLARAPHLAARAVTMTIVTLGWVVFRAPSLHQAGRVLVAMASPNQVSALNGVYVTNDMRCALIAAAAIALVPRAASVFPRGAPWAPRTQAAMLAMFVLAVGKTAADPFTPFIYFRF